MLVRRRATPALLPAELELLAELLVAEADPEDSLPLLSVGELAAVEDAAALLSLEVSTEKDDEALVRRVVPVPVPATPLTAVVLMPTGMPGAVLTKVAAEDWSVAIVGWVVTTVGWLVTTEGWPVTTPRELVIEV